MWHLTDLPSGHGAQAPDLLNPSDHLSPGQASTAATTIDAFHSPILPPRMEGMIIIDMRGHRFSSLKGRPLSRLHATSFGPQTFRFAPATSFTDETWRQSILCAVMRRLAKAAVSAPARAGWNPLAALAGTDQRPAPVNGGYDPGRHGFSLQRRHGRGALC